MLIVDADFFIGYFYKEDSHHPQCEKIFGKIKEDIITSWDVIDEVATKLSYFSQKNKAEEFLKQILQNKIPTVFPDMILLKKAADILKNQTLKHVSMTDCMNMAIARDKKIEYILSFDEIYEKNGFKLFKAE